MPFPVADVLERIAITMQSSEAKSSTLKRGVGPDLPRPGNSALPGRGPPDPLLFGVGAVRK